MLQQLSQLSAEAAGALLPVGGAILGAAGAYYGLKHLASDAKRKASEAMKMAVENKDSIGLIRVDIATIKGDVRDVSGRMKALKETHEDFMDSIRIDRARQDENMREFTKDLKLLLREGCARQCGRNGGK